MCWKDFAISRGIFCFALSVSRLGGLQTSAMVWIKRSAAGLVPWQEQIENGLQAGWDLGGDFATTIRLWPLGWCL